MKNQRLRDFESRATHEPLGAAALAAGGQIVTIHPLADEQDLLARLCLRPEDCWSVDAYWAVNGDVVFLQTYTASQSADREPGLYARLAPYSPRHVNLVVVVDVPYITWAVIETAARDLLRAGWADLKLSEQLIELQPRGTMQTKE